MDDWIARLSGLLRAQLSRACHEPEGDLGRVFCHRLCRVSSAAMVALYARFRRWAEAGFAAFFAYAGFRLLVARL